MDIQQIKERLRSSLEVQLLWRNLIIVLVTTAVMIFIFAIGDEFDGYFWAFSGFTAAVILGPTGIFTAVRAFRIFRKPEGYIFCRATLRQPHGGPVRDSIYYTALLEDPEDGRKFFVDTHAIFHTRGGHPAMEEYTNSTVTIAYNRETEMVVVIG